MPTIIDVKTQDSKKYIAITGASSGIGYATAKAFAQRGKNLIVIARRAERLAALQREITVINPELSVVIKCVDLSIPNEVTKLYQDLRQYFIETWINNAGFGDYAPVATLDLDKISNMLQLNIGALTLLSTLYVKDYQHQAGTQLINLSSRGGYTIVPNAVTYCATKFYVNAFTEGLAYELLACGAKLRAKVLAPAATETEFGQVANDISDYDYQQKFSRYHRSDEMAAFLLALYDSDKTVGYVDTDDFQFKLSDPQFSYSGNAAKNQR